MSAFLSSACCFVMPTNFIVCVINLFFIGTDVVVVVVVAGASVVVVIVVVVGSGD
jgi:hypothetical protein